MKLKILTILALLHGSDIFGFFATLGLNHPPLEGGSRSVATRGGVKKG